MGPFRLFIRTVGALAICIASLLAGVASASAAEPGCTSPSMYVVAHEDDSLLFQSPSVLQDIQTERCVRTVFLTAGDAGRTQTYWSGREVGAEDGYAQMAGVANTWTHSQITVNGHSIRLATLTAKPTISLVFLRLPDGGTEGVGFPAYGNQSLMKLWDQGNPDEEGPEISSIKAVDNSTTYGYEDLIETLEGMIQSFEPRQLYTQNYTVPLISADHPDHVATGLFTREASRTYLVSHRLLGFEDYETTSKAQNVFGTLLGAKSAAFYKYGTHDSDACKSEGACTGTSYAAWLLRQYPLTSKAETTGVVANAGFMQLSEINTSVKLDGSGSSRQGGGTITYAWAQTGGPTVTLSSATAKEPTFTTPSHPTKLTFSLTVKGGATTSAPDTVFIKVPSADPTPTAIAGSTQTVASGAKVTLNGGESWDPNSLPLQYSWLQTSGPALTIAGSSTATPSFTAPTGPVTLKFSLMVSNGNQTSAPSTVTINVKGVAPGFSSEPTAAFTTGVAGSFTVVASGSPMPTLSREGELPPGLSYTDNGNGTATIAGTPAAAAAPPASSQGWPIKFKASNSEGSESQTLNLTVTNPGVKPDFSTGSSTSFTTGVAGAFTVSAGGEPSPAVTLSAGTLPSGVFFTPGTGSGTLSGTPDASAAEPGQSRNYPLTFKAKNGAGEKTQSFTLSVTNPGTAPTFTSGTLAPFTTGTLGSFTITASGAPAPSLAKVSGSLPSGLSFADQGNGSAKISGTPAAAAAPPGESRDFTIEVEAVNGAGHPKQTLTIRVTNPGTPPSFTSATSASFTTGTAASFAITTSGAPTAAISLKSGTLPAGLKLTDNGDGSAKISGTPEASAAPPGESQTYNVELLAKSLAGEKPQTLTLSVKNPGTPPSFGSATAATFTTGAPGSFKVETAGNPTAALSVSGTLPANLKLTDNGDGTATLSGTATAAAAEPGKSQNYTLTFKAKSAAGEKTQTFTLTVKNPGTPPSFTSAATTIFVVGVAKTFTVQTASNPTASLTRTGALPTGLSFTDNGDGTATISGTAGAATAPPAGKQDYPLTLEADALSGDETQDFTLSVTNPGTPPSFTSATSASFTTGTAASFAITTSGAPTAAISLKSGTLPAGLKLTDNGDGSAKISGTPEASAAPPGESQTYNVELLAKSLAGEKPQTLTLSVKNPGTPPSFGSATAATFTTGAPGSFKVETAGNPTAALSVSGTLPANLKLTDNGDGTATLSGTATAAAAEPGKSQNYTLTFKAKSAAGEKTQTFTLTVKNPGTPPSFTSAATTIFVVGVAKTFTVQTASNPTASLTRTGALPTGLSFTDNGDGTATISGTAGAATAPPAGKQDYPLTLEADALSGDETQDFTLSVTNPGTPPSFTSATSASFTTGTAASFAITTSGAPTAAISLKSGTLPAGLKLTDNGDGSAKISGTPEASAAPPGESQTYNVELLAKSLAGEKPQTLTLSVKNPGTPPSFGSATAATFTTGAPGSFKVETAGNPTAALSVSGTLPANLKLTDNGDGTATLSGTATAAAAEPGKSQNYTLTFKAKSAAGEKTQTFTLTVKNPGTPPSFTSAATTIFVVGVAKTFTVQTASNPTASLTRTGALPTGLSFTDNGDGTATISGTAGAATAPPAGKQDYPLTLEADALSGDETQDFTLSVTNPGTPPSFGPGTTGSFTTGVAGSFKVTTTGAPTAALTISAGTLPEWLSFTDNGDGSATFAGTPPASAAPPASSKNFNFTVKAKSGAGEKTQSITLTVTNPGNAPTIASATSTSFTTGSAGSFEIVSTGSPAPTVAVTGELPPGVKFTDTGNGRGTISGTPTNAAAPPASSKNWPVTISAVSTAGKATQTFTVIVTNPGVKPAFTSVASTSFTTGTAGSYTVSSAGSPNAALTVTEGELPTGVKLTDNGDGSATLAGTAPGSAAPPASSKPYIFTIRAKSGAGEVTQSFTLTVVNPGVKPAFTTATSAPFTTGTAGSFTISASGSPTAALSRIEGELPEGLSFSDKGNGSATIAGTPAASAAPAAGSQAYPLTIKATNGAGSATQSLTLTVTNPGVKPQITSATSTSFTTGTAGSFKVVSSGDPTAALSVSGELPTGVEFTDNGNGNGTISGTAAASAAPAGSSRAYPVTIKATNGAGSVSQPFTLTVANPGTGPSITSAASTSFETGVAGSFEVKSTGNPTPSLSATGTLPPGVHFTDKGNGSGTISGTPEASAAPPGESQDYTFTIKATSGVGNVPQAFTLTVVNPGVDPSITSVASTTFTTGVGATFTITTGGDPVPALSKTGGLPDGLSFAVKGDGTAMIAGTPDQSAADPGQSRVYSLTLKAKSAAGEDTQPFTLTVINPGVKPAITSDPSVSFTTGVEKTFTISSNGNPVAALARSGNLPSGLTFTDNGDGSAKISGTAAAAAAAPGTSQNYLLTLEASSAAGSTTQPFTLTVINPEQPTVNTPDTPPQPQPPVVIPPANPLPPEPPVRVALSQAKVLLPIGRYARRIVQVTAPSLASVTCKGKLPKGARCRIMAPGKVVVEGSKAVKRTGTFRLTIHVADADGANVRRPLIVQMLEPDDPALRMARP